MTLEDFLDTSLPSDSCLLWTTGIDPDGYGRISVNGVQRKVHRVAYEVTYGDVPLGHVLHHTCGLKACVNPTHLEPMTRQAHQSLHHRRLTDEVEKEIAEDMRSLSVKYGVSFETLKKVATRAT